MDKNNKSSNFSKKDFRYKERNIYNDLKFLLALNNVEYNERRGTCQRAGIKKKIFQSQAELDMAIRHAKNLITRFQLP